jgi:hypothetical protein
MPRVKSIQVIALSLMLVTELSDWRWFDLDDGPEPDLYELNHSQVYPTAILARARLQEQIEAPPAVFAPPPAMLGGLARPDDFVFDVTDESPIAPPAEDDPVYGYMSLQC